MSLFHVRDKELQTSTFTAAAELTLENGAVMLQEDEVTPIDLDGSVSWTVHIIPVPPQKSLFVVPNGEIFSTVVEENYIIANEAGEDVLNEAGEEILDEIFDTWPTPLFHA